MSDHVGGWTLPPIPPPDVEEEGLLVQELYRRLYYRAQASRGPTSGNKENIRQDRMSCETYHIVVASPYLAELVCWALTYSYSVVWGQAFGTSVPTHFIIPALHRRNDRISVDLSYDHDTHVQYYREACDSLVGWQYYRALGSRYVENGADFAM